MGTCSSQVGSERNSIEKHHSKSEDGGISLRDQRAGAAVKELLLKLRLCKIPIRVGRSDKAIGTDSLK